VSALEAVVKVCQANGMALVAADTDSVARGAVAALAIDYYQLGRQTGEMIDKILKGTSPATLPVETLREFELHVNLQAAAATGLDLQPAFIERAAKVIR